MCSFLLLTRSAQGTAPTYIWGALGATRDVIRPSLRDRGFGTREAKTNRGSTGVQRMPRETCFSGPYFICQKGRIVPEPPLAR